MGLICILRLICRVVSCGISLAATIHSTILSLFLSRPSIFFPPPLLSFPRRGGNLSKFNTRDPSVRRKSSNCRPSSSRNLSKPSPPRSKKIIELLNKVIEESLEIFSSMFEGNHRIVDHHHRRISRNLIHAILHVRRKSSNSQPPSSRNFSKLNTRDPSRSKEIIEFSTT